MGLKEPIGLGVVDVEKSDLTRGVQGFLAECLKHLAQSEAARRLRERISMVDFASSDPVTPYNILARWPGADPDFFAASRADLLLDLLPGGEKPSLTGRALLKEAILLLSEVGLPITDLDKLLHDAQFRRRVLAGCRNRAVAAYFARQFTEIPKATIGALARRIEALLVSEGVRLALSGKTAPDFAALQDADAIILINCFGENISRSVRQLLQSLAILDICQSVFRRKRKDRPFLWFIDEAQALFASQRLRDTLADLVCLARSFGARFCFITQSAVTAVQDPRILNILHTNTRWSFSMRGEPADCAFLKPALPVTGRVLRPQPNPFIEKSFYSVAEERAIALDAIRGLPDRAGYLWLKTQSADALRIRTLDLDIPQGEELEKATLALRRDPTVGMRLSRKEYERMIAERDREWMAESEGEWSEKLEQAYRSARGQSE